MSDNAPSSGLKADPALMARARSEVDRRFYGTWSGAVGTAVTGVLVASLMWPHADHARLMAWCGANLLVATAMYVSNTVPRLRRTINSDGVARVSVVVSMLAGSMFGSLLWLDGALADDPVSRATLLAVYLGLTAGSVGGLAGIAGIGRYFAYPMWLLAIAALMVAGQWMLVAGLAFFILLIAKDLTATSSLLFEILYLRELSKEHADLAQRDARRDPLTGLLNRAGLDAATAAQYDYPVTAMFIDLDHFKSVNDRFGHANGDRVLIEVAERLLQTVRPGDTVARLGGDEFLLVFKGELLEPARDRIANAIIAAMEKPFAFDAVEARISASVGITVSAAGSFDLSAAQREADHALYVAKAQGRRRAVSFDDSIRSELEDRAEIETALRGAVEREEIEAWGQPVFDVTTGTIAFVEVLARWKRRDGSFCSPAVFIPLAEEIGVIGDLGQRMLEQAGATLYRWKRHPVLNSSAISVNVSPRQLGDRHFIRAVENTVQRWDIQPGQLILELTETAELHGLDDVHRTLNQLVDLGVALALDDFGSGYSSIQHLLGLPIDYVKIDGAIVSGLGSDERGTAIVRSIRDLAATLGRSVVVEGVESEEQAAELARLDLRLVQGFLFSQVQRLSELEAGACAPVVRTGPAV